MKKFMYTRGGVPFQRLAIHSQGNIYSRQGPSDSDWQVKPCLQGRLNGHCCWPPPRPFKPLRHFEEAPEKGQGLFCSVHRTGVKTGGEASSHPIAIIHVGT